MLEGMLSHGQNFYFLECAYNSKFNSTLFFQSLAKNDVTTWDIKFAIFSSFPPYFRNCNFSILGNYTLEMVSYDDKCGEKIQLMIIKCLFNTDRKVMWSIVY